MLFRRARFILSLAEATSSCAPCQAVPRATAWLLLRRLGVACLALTLTEVLRAVSAPAPRHDVNGVKSKKLLKNNNKDKGSC